MELLSGVASKLGELLVDATINQARYLLCFNSINKELKVKETNLKEAQDGINKRVEQERQIHRAIEVEEDVKTWLEDVDKEMADVRNLKEKIDEKKSCLNGWCPNWGWRYWLALKRDSTTMVGLYGIGGVGKTTLAKFVGNQLRQEKTFDEVGIATVSKDPDIIKVQGELAKSLGLALNEKDEKERAVRLRMMFSESKSSKILIILDDVWNELDLKTVGIPVGDGDNCCKILLTTRLQPVCDRMRCDPQIQLGFLKREEGLDLLREHAGIVVANSTLIGVSERVPNECKGLPLAIKAVGSALKGKGFDEWNLALDKLQDAKLNTIEGMPALKVVTIIGGVLSLKSLRFLDKNLRVLQLIRCDVSDASFLGKLKRLELLYLQRSPIEIPEELSYERHRLKLLHIGSNTISPITIKKFPQLEEFYGRINNWEIEGMSSEESNARLAEFNSQADGSVVCLPKDFTFPKLQRYVICKGEGVDVEMEYGSQRKSLIIENDPPEVTSLGCHNIVPSIDERGLNELTCLAVGDCEDLEWIMDASKSLHGKNMEGARPTCDQPPNSYKIECA
ncbi:hypothetical protein CUMW_263470 [Citrus unshiu]|uniref:AAA+ ATPase domain-containing protein n=1 Tax=Citrus unshiu TaxID=55188 RepID=A0A2H5QVP3_CITUN|nr:hypothetical protein CUMW_263470 [Citrus unshiu]